MWNGLIGLGCATVMATQAMAVDFSGWTEQRFSLFSSNDFTQAGESLGVRSDGAVSLLWTRVTTGDRNATRASWRWTVREGVPPTRLDRKGGDDRNLALYFVFLPQGQVARFSDSGIRRLLDADAARVLVYVWGGDHARGAMLGSPYLGARGSTIVLRGAETGSFGEQVDLAEDYQRAFGAASGQALVGLAVSADSDDTDSVIDAAIADLSLR